MKKLIRLMGVINVSPESFYQDSISKTKKELIKKAIQLTREGADMVDVGAMSTAPYLKTKISEIEEARRLQWAVKTIRSATKCPISVDTSRYEPALAGLTAGATYLNDVTGLNGDTRLLSLARKFKGIILMAHPTTSPRGKKTRPILKVRYILNKSVTKAIQAGIPRSRIVIDPGIGFFRNEKMPWWQWDVNIISELKALRSLKCPVLVGVSRKSFIGELMGGAPPQDRLAGSLAFTRMAIQNGATWIRTHDIAETKRFLHRHHLAG